MNFEERDDQWPGQEEGGQNDWQAEAARMARGAVETHRALHELSEEEFDDYLSRDEKSVWENFDGFLQTRLFGTETPHVGYPGEPEFERFCQIASLPECLAGLCLGRDEEGVPEGFERRRFEFVANKVIVATQSRSESPGLALFGEAVCRSEGVDERALAHYCPQALERLQERSGPLFAALAEGFGRLAEREGEWAKNAFVLLAQRAPWSYGASLHGAEKDLEDFERLLAAGFPFPLEAQAEFFENLPNESGAALERQAQKGMEWMLDSGRVTPAGAREIVSRGKVRPGWAIAALEARALEPEEGFSIRRGRDMRI